MMELQATSIGFKVGEAATRGARGSVHSVFSDVVNVAFGGELYSMSSRRVPRTPYSITVEDAEALPKLREGEMAQLRTDGLQIGCGTHIDTGSASVWKPAAASGETQPRLSPEELSMSLIVHGRSGGMKPLLSMFTAEAREGDNPYSSKARAIIRDMLTRGLEGGEAVKLLGLGPGLTPSGDDFLSGLLATLELSRTPRGLFMAKAGLKRRILGEAVNRTNEISRALLRHYALGMVDENTDGLMTALSTGSQRRLDHAVEGLCRMGHSSGTDLAIGVLTALKLMEERIW